MASDLGLARDPQISIAVSRASPTYGDKPGHDGMGDLGEHRIVHRSVRHHITVARVRRLGTRLFVSGLHGGEAVTAQLEHRASGLDAIELGVVAAEDRALDR